MIRALPVAVTQRRKILFTEQPSVPLEFQIDIVLPGGKDVHSVGDTLAEALLNMAAYLKRKKLDL